MYLQKYFFTTSFLLLFYVFLCAFFPRHVFAADAELLGAEKVDCAGTLFGVIVKDEDGELVPSSYRVRFEGYPSGSDISTYPLEGMGNDGDIKTHTLDVSTSEMHVLVILEEKLSLPAFPWVDSGPGVVAFNRCDLPRAQIVDRVPSDGLITGVKVRINNYYDKLGDNAAYILVSSAKFTDSGGFISNEFVGSESNSERVVGVDSSSVPECTSVSFQLRDAVTSEALSSASYCHGRVADCGPTCTNTAPAVPPVPPAAPGPVGPGGGGYPDLEDYDITKLREALGDLHKYLIAIGIVASVFLIPYIMILMGTGNPENIKKGKEWLISLIGGLVLLVFSGTLIRIIGTDLLGFGG